MVHRTKRCPGRTAKAAQGFGQLPGQEVLPVFPENVPPTASGACYFDLYNLLPVGYCILSDDGTVREANLAAANLLTMCQSELIARPLADFIAPEDSAGFDQALRHLLDTGRTQACELRMLKRDGTRVWVHLIATLGSGSEAEKVLSVVLSGIDEQKQAEEALRISEAKRAAEELQKSERFKQAVLDSVFSQIAVLDQDGTIVAVNEAWKRFALDNGPVPENFVSRTGVGVNYLSICQATLGHSREFSLAAHEGIRKVMDGQLPSFHLEYDCHSPTRERWFRMSVTTMGTENGWVVVAHTDITESSEQLRDTKEKLRALAAYQEQMLEQERKHIALEVHDEMGQLLTALNLDLSLVGLRFGDNHELLVMVDEMHVLLEKTIKVVRHVASNLRPAALDLGLAPAIEWLAEDFSSRWPVRCRLDASDDDIVLDDLLLTAVFRVVQESLTNVARHADAHEVTISLNHCAHELCVVVADDGRGFDTDVVGQDSGFGLFGMRERMLALGGTLRINSAPGKGTAISIKLPIPSKDPS